MFELLLVAAAAAVVAVVFWRQRGKCPQCHRGRALYATGLTKNPDPLDRLDGIDYVERRYIEWKCRYCGHQVWGKPFRIGGGF